MMRIKNTKKFLGCIMLFCFSNLVNAQNVGIGTKNPHSSAVLEVSSSAKIGGVLMPKVNLKSATDDVTIPSPAVGLMVYNTNDAGVKPNEVETDHHYFWNG